MKEYAEDTTLSVCFRKKNAYYLNIILFVLDHVKGFNYA